MKKEPIGERLLRNVTKQSNGCWEWTRYKNVCGYGVIGDGKKIFLTHRVSYEVHIGEVPKGMIVCHKCDNPGCVNPEHLFLGTIKDNVADMVKKNRHIKGEMVPSHKLTKEKALQIRKLYKTGAYTMVKLAEKYGVAYSTVNSVINEVSWKPTTRIY